MANRQLHRRFDCKIANSVDCIRNHKTPLINLKWHKETIQAMLGCYNPWGETPMAFAILLD